MPRRGLRDLDEHPPPRNFQPHQPLNHCPHLQPPHQSQLEPSREPRRGPRDDFSVLGWVLSVATVSRFLVHGFVVGSEAARQRRPAARRRRSECHCYGRSATGITKIKTESEGERAREKKKHTEKNGDNETKHTYGCTRVRMYISKRHTVRYIHTHTHASGTRTRCGKKRARRSRAFLGWRER